MADVILINLESRDKAVPFGLLYIGTYLKKAGYSTKIFTFQLDFNEKIDNKILSNIFQESKNATCIGFSVMTSQVQKSLYLSKLLKERFPEKQIIWGGIHPTLFPEQTIKNRLIDFVIIGEGEETMVELCKALKKNNKKSKNSKMIFQKIDGIAYKDRGKIIKTKTRRLFDLKNSAPPDWDLIDGFVKENLMRFCWGKIYKGTEVHTGRGCPYMCSYCINNILYGKTWRARNIKSIVDEITFLQKKYGIEIVKLRDENFFFDLKRVESFCDELIKRKINIKWETLN